MFELPAQRIISRTKYDIINVYLYQQKISILFLDKESAIGKTSSKSILQKIVG
ncbi:hypothetical protein HanRHA438_Chr13g0609741 [Helianthus annuus]|nr:hypothetical protein HanRHA438_Chr13g0609741 [Helianthus annuus]